MRALVGGIDLLEVGARRREDLAPRNRVARHATAEIMDAPGQLLLVAFAEEIDRGGDPPVAALVELLVAGARTQPDISAAHLHLRAALSGLRATRAARGRPARHPGGIALAE